MADLTWIAEGLKKPGKSKTGLASALGIWPSAVTAMLQGRRRIQVAEIEKAAEYLGLEAPLGADPGTVPLVGYVSAGAATHRFNVGDGELERVRAPEDATENTVAVEVRGDSLGSFFDRWLVYYDDVRSPVTSDLLNKLCVVGLAEDGGTFVKRLRSSKTTGLFHLEGQFGDTIHDAAVEWAAKVKHMAAR